MKALLQRIRQILKDRRTRRFFKRFVGTFAAIVVFITTYALVLPAITMESEASCGIEAHQHSDDCYEEMLVCEIPESSGHLHDETCYDVSMQLACQFDEHQHGEGCYDENGELTCEKKEHTHSEENGCYQEVKELVCGLEESAGHQHDSSCYEKELTCGKEVHTHSTACYRSDDPGNTAEGAAVSSTNSAGVFVNSSSFASTDLVSGEEMSSAGSATATENEITDDFNEYDLNEDGSNEDGLNDQSLNEDGLNDDGLSDGELNAEEPNADNSNAAASGGTIISGESASSGTAAASTSSAASGISANDETASSSNTSAASAASTASSSTDPSAASTSTAATDADTSSASAASTGASAAAATASTAAGAFAQDTYVPALDPLDFNQILTDNTGIYYFHPEDQETAPENSGDITDWKPVEKETILDPDDILRFYLAYSIPAGSLNATNPVARYRLPSNLHLSDSQMESINSAVNGIANQYVSMDTLEITDPVKYSQALGVEAIEGTRRPSDNIDEFFAKHTEMGSQEYISATVKVEDVYDTDDTGDTGNTDDIDAAEGGIDGDGQRIDSSDERVAVNGERTDVNGENSTYLGTDLVFTFTPYSIQKNQHTYDSTGKPTSAGQKIQGWLTFDLRTDQIDFETVGTVDVEKAEDGETADDERTAVDKETADDEGTTVDKEATADIETSADKEVADDEGTTVDKEATTDTETADDIEATADKETTEDIETTEDTEVAVDKGTKEESDSELDKDEQTESDLIEKSVERTVEKTIVEKEAIIVFVPETKDPLSGLDIDEISQTLHLQEIVIEADAVSNDKEEKLDKTEDETAKDDKAEKASLISPAATFQDSITASMGTLATDTEAGNKADLPEQTELTVYVEADEGTFPEGTTMKLSTVEDMDTVASAVEEAVTTDNAVSNKTRGFHALDISFWNAEGKEIEPLKPIRVSIKSESIKQAVEDASIAPVVVHITDPAADQATADTIDGNESNESKSYESEEENEASNPENVEDFEIEEATNGTEEPENDIEEYTNDTEEPANDAGNNEPPIATIVETEKQASTENGDKDDADTLTFEVGMFSVYAVVYTVDFHWEVNGKMYDFSMPGGGFVSFHKLVEALGIVDGTNKGEDGIENTEITDEESADGEQAKAPLTLNGVEVSDATRKFVADVEKVEFSNPELVWVGKVDESTTVGGLKETKELDVQYSAELTGEQIEEINSTVVEFGDWALISVQPFESTESLTVTMKTGEKFIIRVTDANITNATDLVIGEEYILYIIGTDGEYFALRDDGQTLWVPDRELEDLDNHYRWVYSENDEHTGAIWTCNRYRINPYVATNYWYGGWWGDATIYNPGWTPISRLVSLSDGGFKFEDLNNPDRYLAYYSHTNGNDIIRTKWDYSYSDIISIHIFKPGTSYTVRMKSNNEEYGSVKYTLSNNTQSTSASVTSISAETEKSESENKLIPGTITAEPKEGYKFTGWIVQQVNAWDNYQVIQWGEGKTAESPTIQPTVNGNLILQANFEPEKIYTFTVRTDNEEMGTVGGGDSNGNNLTGQTSFETITGAVINNQGRNAYEIEAEKLPLHMFVKWELRDSGNNLIQELTTPTIDANSLVLTGDNMTLTAIFRDKTETEIDEDDIDTLLNSWKADMTNDFVGVDKTAHAHDYDNRIYEIDLTASSGKWAVERSINLDFITDVSRSMYFPANLEFAMNNSESDSSYDNLRTWLNSHGVKGETYYVVSAITESDNSATMYAVHYDTSKNKWVYTDSSYYYFIDNSTERPTYEVPNGMTDSNGNGGLNGKTLSGVIYKSSDAPASYAQHYKPQPMLEQYWSRLDYLFKAVMCATDTLKTINVSSNVHLTTFAKGSNNNGYLGQSAFDEQSVYNTLSQISAVGGTRQDRGLWTARTGTGILATSTFDDLPLSTGDPGPNSAFEKNSDHQQFAIVITDGAPNITSSNTMTSDQIWSSINTQAGELKRIKDSSNENLTLMTLGIGSNFVGDNSGKFDALASDPKYAQNANNGGEIVKAVKELVQSMVEKASLYGTVSDKLNPAFYPVKADGTPITAGFYRMNGDPYTPTANDTTEYCQWTKNGEEWTITYYNQTFRWPTRDSNGNITDNGWERAFYVKAKEDFLGGNTIETNGKTTFTATHTLLLDSNGEERPSTKAEIKNSSNQAAPIVKDDVPTPHVNVKQLTLDGNETQWKVYIETTVDPLPQIKELYNNIQVSEVVSHSVDNMIISKTDMLFPESTAEPETFLLKTVTGEANNINWTTLMDGGTVDIPYMRYGHAPGVVRLALTKTGDNAAYGEHQTSSSQIDTEEYVLTAQYIPYTVDEMVSSDMTGDTDDGAYHTTVNESPGIEQREGRPSENKHTISLFVRGLSLTKTDEFFFHGLTGAEFTVYRPATAGEVSSSDEEVQARLKTFAGDAATYIVDEVLTVDDSGVTFKNSVKSYSLPVTKYYLVETKAPDGYNLREEPIPVELRITDAYTMMPVTAGATPEVQTTKPQTGLYNWDQLASLELLAADGVKRTTGAYDPADPTTDLTHIAITPSSEYEVMYYRISNNPGVELPATGGPGTRLFTILGSVFVMFSGAMLWRRRRYC